MNELPALRVPAWQRLAGLTHGFLGRLGGVSAGDYASLNLSVRLRDDPGAVAENRRRVEASLPGDSRLVWMLQVHGDRIVSVDSKTAEVGAADGMLTDQRGAALAILTADCVPILLVAPRRRVAGAVHAGWRGTLSGIIVRAIDELRRSFRVDPPELEVALGPAIGGCCYEVERDIGERFIRQWGRLRPSAWWTDGDKGRLDLRLANEHLLRQAGLCEAQIHRLGPCTCCAVEEYFSHRRSGGRTGRQVSYIGWTE